MERIALRVISSACAMAAAMGASSASAATIFVNMGASAETFTLYGLGAVAPGVGSFAIGQGATTFDGTTTTATLSGAITGGTAGYNSGTYEFVTTYAGDSMPMGGPNAPIGQSNPSNLAQFFYRSLHPSTQIVLNLNTPGGQFSQPLFSNGMFGPNVGFSFFFTNATCTGVATCIQNNVGLTPGATISGPVTISARFDIPDSPPPAVPEPATWAMMILGFGFVSGAIRSAKRRQMITVSYA